MARINWKVSELATAMKQMQDNKFDCIVAICGRRGIGKSTLGIKLARHFDNFKIKKDVAFSREDVTNQLADKKKGVIVADEVINVMHNREFFNQDQIKLIKMINMYRDSCDILIVCVPSFRDLDKQFRNLVKMRFDVIRRGIGIVHFPIVSQFANDPWDMERNQKVEESWTMSKTFKPKYHLLSTYRGMIMYGDLPPKAREIYERVKKEKRNILVRGEMDVSGEKTKTDKLYDSLIEKLDNNTLDKTYIEEIANILGIKHRAIIKGINIKLKERGDKQTVFEKLREINKVKRKNPLFD